MSKFLITGICGFVGGYFYEYLKRHAPETIVLGLDIANECMLSGDNFTYRQIYLMDRETVHQCIKSFRPDYILHLASFSSVSQSWKMPAKSFINNTNIFLNIVEALRSIGSTARVLSIGSSEEYGNYPETMLPLKEDYKLQPRSPYAIARVSQEMLSSLYASSYQLDIIMTRSFNHIGPRQRDIFVVPSFVHQMVNIAKGRDKGKLYVGNIDVIRDFLDIRDVVDAYYRILIHGKTEEVYNVCSGKGTKLRDIIKETAQQLDIEPEILVDPARIRPMENMCIIGDNSKLYNDIGWKPHYELSKTLQDMISYWQQA